MIERKDGFYWVKYKNWLVSKPEVAQWYSATQSWCMAGNELECDDDNLMVLSERVEEPKGYA